MPTARGALEVEGVIGVRSFCSFLVRAARGALEVEVVTGARALCSLLMPAARGALEVNPHLISEPSARC